MTYRTFAARCRSPARSTRRRGRSRAPRMLDDVRRYRGRARKAALGAAWRWRRANAYLPRTLPDDGKTSASAGDFALRRALLIDALKIALVRPPFIGTIHYTWLRRPHRRRALGTRARARTRLVQPACLFKIE